MAQSVDCAGLVDYRENCRDLTQTSQCSTQLTSVCCSCEQVWNETFEYCRFNAALFPTPTPTLTPTPTQTPTPTLTFTPTAIPALTFTPTSVETQNPEAQPTPEIVPALVEKNGITCKITTPEQQVCATGRTMILVDASESTNFSQYDWKLTCRGDSFNSSKLTRDDFVSNKPLEKKVMATVMEPKSEVQCDVTLALNGSDGTGKPISLKCGTGVNLVKCSNICSSTSIRTQLLVMDSSASSLLKTHKNALSLLLTQKKIKNSKAQAIEAQKLYSTIWSTVWGMPNVLLECTHAPNCVQSSLSSGYDSYTSLLNQLVLKTKSVLKKIDFKKLSKRSKKKFNDLSKSLKHEESKSLQTVQSLPKTQNVCGN